MRKYNTRTILITLFLWFMTGGATISASTHTTETTSDTEKITELYRKAIDMMNESRIDAALECQTEVLKMCGQLDKPHPQNGKFLYMTAYLYYQKGDMATCAEYAEKALPEVEVYGQDYEGILTLLSMAYDELGDIENGLRILDLMDKHNQHELTKECNEPKCHLERASYYALTGDIAHAKDEYALYFAMDVPKEERHEGFLKYGEFLRMLNDNAQAADYFKLASDAMKESSGPSYEATRLAYQAGLLAYIGEDYSKAREILSIVIKDVDRYGYATEMKAEALKTTGNAWAVTENYAEAAKSYREALRIVETGAFEKNQSASLLTNLAFAEKMMKQYDLSIEHYEKAIDIYDSIGDIEEKENAKAGLSFCYLYAGKSTESEETDPTYAKIMREKITENLNNALSSLPGTLYLGKLAYSQTLGNIAGDYALLGQNLNAIEYYEQYVTSLRSVLNEDFLLKNAQERKDTWNYELNNIEGIKELVGALPADSVELIRRGTALMFDCQLLSKGILLSSNIEFNKILKSSGNQELMDRYDLIIQRIDNVQKMRNNKDPLEEITAYNRATDGLQLDLMRHVAKLGQFTDLLSVTRKDVVAALGKKSAAVEFVQMNDLDILDGNRIMAVIVTKEHPDGIMVNICRDKDIESIMNDPGRFIDREFGHDIWDKIIQAAGDKEKIYFSPDGVLNNLGIEYLLFDGKPVNSRIDLVRVSSTRELCRESRQVPIRSATLFGNIDYYDDGVELPHVDKVYGSTEGKRGYVGLFSDLENTEREIDEINCMLSAHIASGSDAVRKYSGQKANKECFLNQGTQAVDLIHIATHGKFIESRHQSDTDAMTRSVLAFAGANLTQSLEENPSLANAAEIAEMSLNNCDMVVLSACESGLGKLGNDGVFGLQRGFKNAGVRTLLVSLNEVADESTADMMISFYNHYLNDKKMSKQKALRQAQAEIRDRYPDDDTWASFILIDAMN